MRIDAGKVGKWVGLAGVAGVVATGALAVRAERKRRAYTPDEVRERLHVRLAQASSAGTLSLPAPDPEHMVRRRIRRLLRRSR
ncbi:hypothetical protein G4X40_14920 [Rhodococcus sp. D2-41]|uniref:hypothetical protein n=1 Tax=Speluncibacter jeojiensis TaxID=2710754 RepID=UPI0024109DDB|nr:hypothetical protein [Rhodococcus sp. D2-41]MDG3011439.1 hypothetical protein [Rhodococcus sp. D2-41]